MKTASRKRMGITGMIFSFFILIFSLGETLAAPVTQNITLKPGWNAVFLEVQPTVINPAYVPPAGQEARATDPGNVFFDVAGLESVWRWKPNSSTVEFIQDPTALVPEDPSWLVYYPDPGQSVLTNLNAIRANTPYLIKLGGTPDVIWSVTGEPVVPHIDWKPNSFNFVGFHLEPGQEPFFGGFFSSSAAHADQDIYVLNNTSGSWEKVTLPFTDKMLRGEAFWVYTHGSSEFNGPVSVQLERADGLHYGDVLTTQDVIFKNDSLDDQQLISLSLSAGAPADLLYYWNLNAVTNTFEWAAFPPPDLDIAAGGTERLTLGVKRAGLTSADILAANIGVTDGAGTTFQIPLSVTGIDYAGLWVGQVMVNKVSEVQTGNVETTPTGSEFSFRIIVHLDDTGQAKLLSQVIQMWDENIPGPVLFTDDALIPNYSGATLRDGKPVGRRISAPAFHNFKQSLLAPNGNFGTQGGVLTTTLILPADDATNPFIHRNNPNHLVPVLDDPVPENNTPANKKYGISREIKMTFSDQDADGTNIVGSSGLGWGSSDMGGIYEEIITGLHKAPFFIKGTLLLHRVSKKGSLAL